MAIDPKYSSEYIALEFKNVEIRWAKVQPEQYDDYQGVRSWKFDMILNDKLAKAMEKEGFNVKQDDEGKYFVTAKKAWKKKDGSSNKPMGIVGRDGRTPVTEELGNGTIINAKCSAHKWPTSKTITLYGDKIQVVDLKVYEGASGFESLDKDDVPF